MATNGVVGDSDDEDDDDVESAENEESEESERPNDADEDKVDYDVMGGDNDSDVEAAAPPAKVQKIGSAFPHRR